MKRKDTLREFLKAVFGTHNVKIADDKIYYNNTLFRECEFNFDDYVDYVKLLRIAFLQDSPRMQKPTKDVKEFPREECKQNFFKYIENYEGKIPSSVYDKKLSDYFAYEAAIEILEAIFTDSEYKDIFKLESEDISQAFRKAIDSIEYIVIDPDDPLCIRQLRNNDEILDDDYTGDSDSFNYSLPIILSGDIIPETVKEPKIKIYVDKSGKYDEKSQFFFRNIVSTLSKYKDSYYINTIKDNVNQTERYLEKALSYTTIKYISISFVFVTHLDEENIIKDYKCTDDIELTRILTDKAKKQYCPILLNQIKEYELSLIEYTADLIKRILSLDLNWLYGGDKKTSEKCWEEIEKIVIGYNDLHIYFDICEEAVAIKQLLTILHHAVVEVTNYLNKNKEYIAECVKRNDWSDRREYVKGIVNGKFKHLEEFAEGISDSEISDPECLGEAYYYTSCNELTKLLEEVKGYYELLKKTRKNS